MGSRPRLQDLSAVRKGLALVTTELDLTKLAWISAISRVPPSSFIRKTHWALILLSPSLFTRFTRRHRAKGIRTWPCPMETLMSGRAGRPCSRHAEGTGKPYVIENVDWAPLLSYIVLRGKMFKEPRVPRNRLFETIFPVLMPPH